MIDPPESEVPPAPERDGVQLQKEMEAKRQELLKLKEESDAKIRELLQSTRPPADEVKPT
jgi:hypothetical protein